MLEEDYIMISALQHFAFCERQCALIHLEQQWGENQFTVQGKILHEKADSGVSQQRGDTFVSRSLRLKSNRLGLVGTADVVEFSKAEEGGITLPGRSGLWIPCPVEYKRGRSKEDDIDRIQLCAQAICLEEMLKTNIKEGALYYAKAKRREWVTITESLREKTEKITQRIHELIQSGKTPPPVNEPKCNRCSLYDSCSPQTSSGKSRSQSYYNSLFTPSET